ncbi:winged helix-turn-helix domain-containing protein [Pseudomonas asplenii]|uniref:winged helix-turn-helix domain-containing protein n=1 Tax=Pseudomonas asplenii TaxID=53407 RepID=UPI0006B514CC|nr:response regulator transcription factor [Pseudomonas fuscovaginae]KPA99159.1 response regulator with CheY-like receiver domain and winged-helix DNA-binding domain [Pseudomonas fuscovaginae]
MKSMPRVLVVEPDRLIREQLQACLAAEGYGVDGVASTERAACLLERQPVALVVLNMQLPACLQRVRQWRANSQVGIILVGGRNDEAERIAALDCGADDCLGSPLNPRELLCRARNLLRRIQPDQPADSSHLARFAEWTLDTERRRLKAFDGSETLLSHGEFQLLKVFLRNSGQTLSRDQLMEQLRNREWLPSDRSIDVLVGRLRRKLHDNPAAPELIITIHGAGYLFTARTSRAA